MMEGALPAFLLAAWSAVWLGVLTSISPCPLASNIAALSYLSKDLEKRGAVLLSGTFYTAGRVIAYVGVSSAVVTGLLSIPSLARFLQTWTNKALGPLLILLALVLLEIVKFPSLSLASSDGSGRLERLARGGLPGAAALGFIFALSFCPISAALFFGSLIPLSVEHGSRLVIPALFGIGTAAPVALFAVMIATGARSLGKAYDRITTFALWAKRVTAAVFFLAGLYYLLTYWFGVSVWGG
jgi:cytochrome c biogenesis protein CcdA